MIDTIPKNLIIQKFPSIIVNENAMFGTGQLPKFENDQFEVKLER